ncbi:MAG TPA: tetratricopeptide repeat protein [Bacteroidales bacterium]|nr:tetratricopeptide repeat protein [Bacteroidales bacterium]
MKEKIILLTFIVLGVSFSSCGGDEEKFRYHLENGIDLIFQARIQEAEVELNKALRQKPNSHEAIYYLGACRRSLGDVEGAKARFEEAIKLNPTYAEPYLGLALIYQDVYQDRDMACQYFLMAEDLGMKSLMDYTKRCR